MRWVVAGLGVVVAVVVGQAFGWRWVFAPVIGALVIGWLVGSLRAMTSDSRARAHLEQPQPVVIPEPERTLFWCQECGTELLLVVRGTGKPPRHCATVMHERAEVGDDA